MVESRQQEMALFFGTNGTGKTTLMMGAAANYLQANAAKEKRVLFCVPDDSERKFDNIEEITSEPESLYEFDGAKKILCEDRKVFTDIYKAYTAKGKPSFNGLMIFDDIGVILNRRPEEALIMLKRRRQMNADMFFNFHGLHTDMPRSFFTYATRIVLLKTGDDYEDTMKKLPPIKRIEFEEMYKRVERSSIENPYYFEELKLR